MITHFQNPRCLSQQGSFTFCTDLFHDHDDPISELLSEAPVRGEFCAKLVIPANLKVEFLARLRGMGITAEMLFPGLEGLGRALGTLVDLRASREMNEFEGGALDVGGGTKIL